jgi:hypothetical protein
MPVDIHKEEGVPGVELILSRLHAGGKFSEGNYNFSGGLHGVGVSVVNALSTHLEVTIRRDGQVHRMTFANGDKASELEVIDTVGKRNTGTRLKTGFGIICAPLWPILKPCRWSRSPAVFPVIRKRWTGQFSGCRRAVMPSWKATST